MPKGFPAATLYELYDTPGAGDVLLAPGPRDVYYRKKLVPPDKQVGFGSCFAMLDRNAMNISYLARLDGPLSDHTEQLFHKNTNVRFSGADGLRRQMELALQNQEAEIRGFIQTIAQKNNLRLPDVQLSIVPEVDDARANRTEPLPQPSSRQFDLR